MLKPTTAIAVGDYVLLESIITSRIVGRPYRVTSIAKSRVYIERHRLDPKTAEPYLDEKKFVLLKSIRHVFTDEASAQAVSDFAGANSQEYEAKASALKAEYQQKFADYISSLQST